LNVVRASTVPGGLPPDALERAGRALAAGKLIVYPTDTLYALGALASNPEGIERLFEAKGRDRGRPVSLAFASLEAIGHYCDVTPLARKVADRFLPGPITMLLLAKAEVPGIVEAGSLLGVRVPDSPVALALCQRFGALTCTSANVHGRASPLTCDDAAAQLGDKVELYLDAGRTVHAGPSTVVDCSGTAIKIIRNGVISERELMS